MALVGPGYLADNVEHGAALTTRVKETLNLIRQLDVASRLLTFRIDELSGRHNKHGVKRAAADDEHVDRSEEDSGRGGGGCGSGKKRARASGGHAYVDDDACVNTKQNNKRKAAASDVSRKDDGPATTRAGRKHGDRALLERLKRAALRCADEKVALAAHLYELLDLQVRYIDSDLRRFEKHYGFIPPFVPPPPAAPLGRRRSDHHTKEREASQMSASGSDDVSTKGAGIHPNEPTYCFCRQVAFGEMIACDNLNCEIEWFHYGCVGLTKPPGTWMCRNCKKTLRSKSLGGAVGSGSSL